MKTFMLVVAGVLLAGRVFAADMYKIDAAHSSIGFSAKHMMISTVPGQFDQFDGTIAYAPNDATSKISITIPVASIDTHNDKRDGHLKSPDFFDAAQFPNITFVSTSITATAITGDLTIKGVTKEVMVPATITGPVKGMMGKDVIGINAAFTVNRQDYGVSYNKVLDQGGVAVANEIPVTISIEADKE